jgi:hypothetical protein
MISTDMGNAMDQTAPQGDTSYQYLESAIAVAPVINPISNWYTLWLDNPKYF